MKAKGINFVERIIVNAILIGFLQGGQFVDD